MQKSSKPKTRRAPDRVHLRLTLDIHYETRGVSERYLRDELEQMVQAASSNGAFTGPSEAETEQWKFRIENVANLKPRAPRLTREGKLLAIAKASHNDLANVIKTIDKIGLSLAGAEKWLDGLAQQAVFAAAYVGSRGANGCGDAGHDEAIKDAQRQLKQVRKVIGYAYP